MRSLSQKNRTSLDLVSGKLQCVNVAAGEGINSELDAVKARRVVDGAFGYYHSDDTWVVVTPSRPKTAGQGEGEENQEPGEGVEELAILAHGSGVDSFVAEMKRSDVTADSES